MRRAFHASCSSSFTLVFASYDILCAYSEKVDNRRIHEASERRVQPGTPIHSLKKRLKRTAGAAKPAPTAQAEPRASSSVPEAAAAAAAATSKATTGGTQGTSALIPTARAQGKAKAAAAARVPGHVNGVSRSLDSARTKEVSDYLKSQISEANMLLEVRRSKRGTTSSVDSSLRCERSSYLKQAARLKAAARDA